MNLRKLLTILAILFLDATHMFGQQPSMKDLRPIFDHLKSIKTYSYENHTSGVFPNGQSDAMITKVFMDKTKQCLVYTNKGETVLLNHKWIYKANHVAKVVQVFDINAYNKRNKKLLPDVRTLFQYDVASMLIDSVIMKYGKLQSSEKKGALVTYRIGFPQGIGFKDVVIVYNESSQLPESIYVKTLREEGSRKMQTEILCNNYKAVLSPAVFDEHLYFSAAGGKIALTQFKNYKVYSLL